MTPFEEELKKALERQEPAAWRLRAVAAALLIAAGGGTMYQQHEREVRGSAAKRKLILAVRIAGSKLQEVQQRVAESAEVEQ
jgi:hypothetical protein